MQRLILVCAFVFTSSSFADEALWATFPGKEGPGKGKKVVLVSGDEEYRSEEVLTQLAKILSQHHGFDCVVLYAIDPKTNTINPNVTNNIPGLSQLEKADLMILFTRFRRLPDDQLKYFDDYLKTGKPIIGLRTATHAFNTPSKEFANFHWQSKAKGWEGGFGKAILGETWVAHHGNHGREATKGVLVAEQKDHPILRGVKGEEIFGPTDVYRVNLPLPGDSTPLVLGQVLTGMKITDPAVDGPKNSPMMPIAWTKSYEVVPGKKGKVFTTTMGASEDLLSVGLRRLLVNATFWSLGMDETIKPDLNVSIVGEFKATPFGNNKFVPNVKPADLMIK
ncbi:MAG: ThuA domain-containing protein [Zavarzinella sp.]